MSDRKGYVLIVPTRKCSIRMQASIEALERDSTVGVVANVIQQGNGKEAGVEDVWKLLQLIDSLRTCHRSALLFG